MSDDDATACAERNNGEVSHATLYRRKGAEPDKFPALKLDADNKALSFSHSFDVSEQLRSAMRDELASAFERTFSQPAKLKSPANVTATVSRLGDRLEKFIKFYAGLDAQERSIAEVVLSIDDNNFELRPLMDELARAVRGFHEKLHMMKELGTYPRSAGPEFDPRIRALVPLLAEIFLRYVGNSIATYKSLDGTYQGRFIQFCRAACEHFLPAGVARDATLVEAAIWVSANIHFDEAPAG